MPRRDESIQIGHDVPPEVIASIEASSKMTIDDLKANPELVQFAVDRSKKSGNDAFKAGRMRDAVRMYTQAIAGAPGDAALHGNRSAAKLALGEHDGALLDATRCVELDPEWAKGHYRLGCALACFGEWIAAARSFQRADLLAPGSKDIAERLAAATELAAEETGRVVAQVESQRRDLAQRLRCARRADARENILSAWRQQNSGYEWDVEDYEWRPTYLPLMRARVADKKRFMKDERRAMALNFAVAAAELDAPKKTLPALRDRCRLDAYAAAAVRVFETVGDEPALAVANGAGGVLAMTTAAAGFGTVFAVDRSRFHYRMAKQCIRENPRVQPSIVLIDQKLEMCKVVPNPDPKAADSCEDSSASKKKEANVTERCKVVITDLMDHSCLGFGLLSAIDHVGTNLAAPDAVCVPGRVVVRAALLSLRTETVSGFDLRSLNQYRWHPQAAKFLNLADEPHDVLSEHFEVADIDLTARLRAAAARGDANEDKDKDKDKEKFGGAAAFESDVKIEVKPLKDGVWNAVAFWFELDMGGNQWLRSATPPAVGGDGSGSDRFDRFVSDAESWGVAVQYLDELPVGKNGPPVTVRVRRDAGQILFTSDPPPTRPRHSNIPQWHYDMLNDAGRNDAYEAAIVAAVNRRKKSGGKIDALDAGSGSGLLAMMAARAGADFVAAVEKTPSMVDAGEENVCMNGLAHKVLCLNRDVRRVFTKESRGLQPVPGEAAEGGGGLIKTDGSVPELDRKVDLMVYEVFDSGLIGEGALHILANARYRLLRPDTTLVPASATVFAQPIEYRISTVTCGDLGAFEMKQSNRWRWRDTYEGHNLERCKGDWRPLGEPFRVFDFDFAQIGPETLTPGHVAKDVAVTDPGVFNAIAFWFELRLDENNVLSTSPHDGTKGQTWQQAVQWVEEMSLQVGDVLPLVASHDTYAITFAVDDARFPQRGMRRTGVPLYDPSWGVQHERVKAVNHRMAPTLTQNPIEYRTMAETAVAAGARPHDLGLDAESGADFCLRMMG